MRPSSVHISLCRSKHGFHIVWLESEPETHSKDISIDPRPDYWDNQASGQQLYTRNPPSPSLSSHLSASMCRSLDSRSRSFLPRNQLPTLTQPSVVVARNHQPTLPQNDLDSLSVHIFKGLLRTLAVLILLDKLACISTFVSEGFTDSSLPIRDSHFQKGQEPTLETLRRCFKNWTKKEIDTFMETQWAVLSPFFKKSVNDVSLYDFDSDTILPFTEDEHDGTPNRRAGGYGVVRRVKIHRSHHDFDQDPVRSRHPIPQYELNITDYS